jgi:imidazolonepropionase-like amidohydrolase
MNMRLASLVFALICAGSPALGQPVSLEQLLKPPAEAQQFTIMSSSGQHGRSFRWTGSDGTRYGRESLGLRGQVYETDSSIRLGADGMIDRVIIRGFTPEGDAAETFTIATSQASWKSPVDAGSAAYSSPSMYATFGGPVDTVAELFEAVIAAPGQTLSLLPGGRVRATPLTSLTLGSGNAALTLHAFSIAGLQNLPMPVWMDAQGKFFAFDQGITWIRAGYETFQPQIDKAQAEALAQLSPAVRQQLLQVPTGPVAFTHVRAFLHGDHFATDQTVVVEHGIIVAVGPSASTPAPPGARVVDGAGKTLVPGLWDSHQHVMDEASGPMLLSLGITSVRDPGNNNDLTLSRIRRRASGQLLLPHVYPSVLIDGKGPNTAQLGSVATSEEEAIAIVRKAKAEGFTGIKIYGTFNPDWVKATAAEAHRLGLHVHGHLPAGMRTMQAIDDGYDEITHIYFVIMQAMPDSVVSKSNGIARMEGPGRYAKDVNLQAEPMKSLIETMSQRHITSDPTLVVVESLLVPENGDLSPAYAPYVGTLPPAMERGFRQGGLTVPPDLTRADFRASFAKMALLVQLMHSSGVPIVAGTDGFGLELVRELELYVNAGFTPEQALAAATLAPAHLLGVDNKTGSIDTGKVADLLLVEGDPSRNIGDLRQTRVVMMDGDWMDADALRTQSGFSGRPKTAR